MKRCKNYTKADAPDELEAKQKTKDRGKLKAQKSAADALEQITAQFGLKKSRKAEPVQQRVIANDDNIKSVVADAIAEHGKNADLNYIDVSCVTRFDMLFHQSEFNGDISKWDVSRGKTFYMMFHQSAFNGDLSKWDVSAGRSFSGMFEYSQLNSACLNKWDISSAVYTADMFAHSANKKADLSGWELPKGLTDGAEMFYQSQLQQKHLPKWDFSKDIFKTVDGVFNAGRTADVIDAEQKAEEKKNKKHDKSNRKPAGKTGRK